MSNGFALFETAIGKCGIAWNPRGIAGVQLPEGADAKTRARMARRFPAAQESAPPADVQQALSGITALLAGNPADLSVIALDMDGQPPFHQRVYEVARSIPPGETRTYGDIAKALGLPGSARAVGQALGRNPFAIVVPCHRVLAAGSKAGGFSANGGVVTKLKMLAIESKCGDPEPLPYDARAAVAHLRSVDPDLSRVIDAVGPYRIELQTTSSIFVALAEAIVYQQLSGKAAATIYARVRALFPYSVDGPTPEQVLRASDAKLRGAGLSRSKLLSLRDLAQRASRGEIPTLEQMRAMEDDAIVERLTEVRGIGRWTSEMLLIFRLGRPDVLPLDDYGVRKGFAKAFGKRKLPSREQMEKRGKLWKPYRTVASWYLWRVLAL